MNDELCDIWRTAEFPWHPTSALCISHHAHAFPVNGGSRQAFQSFSVGIFFFALKNDTQKFGLQSVVEEFRMAAECNSIQTAVDIAL